PRQPGEATSLTLQGPLGDETPTPPKLRRPLRIPAYVPIVLALCVLGIVLLLLTRPWSFLSFGSPGKPHVRKFVALLPQWGDTTFDEKDATKTEAVGRHFFAFLSRPAWADRLDADAHPYHAFVLRLPDAPIRVSNPEDEVSVRSGLRELLEGLCWR